MNRKKLIEGQLAVGIFYAVVAFFVLSFAKACGYEDVFPSFNANQSEHSIERPIGRQ